MSEDAVRCTVCFRGCLLRAGQTGFAARGKTRADRSSAPTTVS